MPIYRLPDNDYVFPPVELAEPDGLLAVGGGLETPRLVAAYASGIFPWYGEGSPILWWSPDPRCFLIPEKFHIPKRLKRFVKKSPFTVSFDVCFERVIRNCALAQRPSSSGDGTWIVEEMIEAYCALHKAGFAHSVEIWEQDDNASSLVGGLYGVALGRAFFGESMFHKRTNASKVALIALLKVLSAWEFTLIDCQQTTAHICTFGAEEAPRGEFMDRLQQALQGGTVRGKWTEEAHLIYYGEHAS